VKFSVIVALFGALSLVPGGLEADEANVPAGPAAIRRLLRLDRERPAASFFLDLSVALGSESAAKASWEDVEQRRRVIAFLDDLAEWRRSFGAVARFQATAASWKGTRQALDWLGFDVKGEGTSFSLTPREGETDIRRQRFLEALGVSLGDVERDLRDGKEVTIETRDEAVPFPFGFELWREILGLARGELEGRDAFLLMVKNVQASRMLVALHAVDAETREGVRTLARNGNNVPIGWKLVFDDAFDGFTRFPEALSFRDGRFALPGGREAEPIWTDLIGASPDQDRKFLTAFFRADSGKIAYVADALQQVSEAAARAILVGKARRDTEKKKQIVGPFVLEIERFQRLYSSIERSNASFLKGKRDPYDFMHLVRFLRVAGDGKLSIPGGTDVWTLALSRDDIPRSEGELAKMLEGGSRRHAEPEELLETLFSREVAAGQRTIAAQKRFLLVSSLLESHPVLVDPGLIVLLYRGLERFLPAFALLEELPNEPATLLVARRYLLLLARLDAGSSRREAEVRAGTFQAAVEIVAALHRSGALDDTSTLGLLDRLLRLEAFAGDGSRPTDLSALWEWVDEGLLASLRAEERTFLEARRHENEGLERLYREALGARDARILERRRALPVPPAAPPVRIAGELPGSTAIADAKEPMPRLARARGTEPSSSPDDLLLTALVGRKPAATFQWRGGRYRFDAAADEAALHRRFLGHQRLANLSTVADAMARRKALLALAGQGSLAGLREAVDALSKALELADGAGPTPTGVPRQDPRVTRAEADARDQLADAAAIASTKALTRLPERLAYVDVVIAERLFEALLGQVYATAMVDPDDIYYQDPDFVRRHSFRWVDSKGILEWPFMPTRIVPLPEGRGSTIAGSLAGLTDALALLHAEQVVYAPGAWIANESVRAGIVSPVHRMSLALLDDDAVTFVAESCEATRETAVALAGRDRGERARTWGALAHDLVSRARLDALASLARDEARDRLREILTPSDLYRIGRRLALGPAPAGTPVSEAARRARAAHDALVRRAGEAGAARRLAELGPHAAFYAGRLQLADLDLPPYERLAEYVLPQLFSERLYDVKIAVSRLVAAAGWPATVLRIVLPEATEELISKTRMSHPFDWSSIVRETLAISAADLDRYLATALDDGRLTRDDEEETKPDEK